MAWSISLPASRRPSEDALHSPLRPIAKCKLATADFGWDVEILLVVRQNHIVALNLLDCLLQFLRLFRVRIKTFQRVLRFGNGIPESLLIGLALVGAARAIPPHIQAGRIGVAQRIIERVPCN